MNPERWKKIEDLYHEAAARNPNARAAFLDGACGPDAELRQEVESLLRRESKAGSFLESVSRTATQVGVLPGQIGPYRLTSTLGAGGMGEVYRAHDSKLGRDVALKTLSREFASHPERLARFRREARMLASLNHPNIGAIYGLEEAGGSTWLVLELVEGENLKAPQPIDKAVDLACQVAEALDAAHTAGIIHRDLKPANIKVTPQGRVKVLDFGLAKALGGPDESLEGALPSTVTAFHSMAGQIAGTPPYMSPEQARGESLDGRTDLWSLGVILYELSSGARPFDTGASGGILETILTREPSPLRQRNPKAPAALERIVARLLHKDRERRYQSAAELLRDLRKLQVRTHSAARRYWAGAAAALLVTAGATLLWQRLSKPPLTDKDVLVLADFTNTTGEPVFDGTLREALAIQIDNSPFLKTLSDERVRIDLRLMGRALSQRITNDLAREICQRENQKAMIGGSISSLGKTYVITLQSTDCRSGDTLARVQAEAPDREQVLAAVAEAARGMRRKLGEALSSIQRLEPTRETDRVTTTSIAAFQAFAQGVSLMRQGAMLDALAVMRRATELDPNFATAWNYMAVLHGVAIGTDFKNDAHEEYNARAFALRDRVTEAERFLIDSGYYASRQEWEKRVQNNTLWARTYPRSHIAYTQLGTAHRSLGELEDSLGANLEAYRLEPRISLSHSRLVEAYKDLDRFAEARRIGAAELAQNPDDARLREVLLQVSLIERDDAHTREQMDWFRGRPVEYLALQHAMEGAKFSGQLRGANEMYRQVTAMRERHGMLLGDSFLSAGEAALLGECPAAVPPLSSSSLLWRDRDLMAVALALCGDSAQSAKALKRGEEALAERPDNTMVKAIQLPMLRAVAELKNGSPARAIELLQPVIHYERRYPEVVYLRGLSYLQARDGTQASAEFQKILDHKGAYWGPVYPVAYVGLARAAVIAGDTARAKRAYQDFLTLWKEADPHIPILTSARKEYAALN